MGSDFFVISHSFATRIFSFSALRSVWGKLYHKTVKKSRDQPLNYADKKKEKTRDKDYSLIQFQVSVT